MKKNRRLKTTAFYVTVLTLVSKLFGFIREIVMAYFFGTSVDVDAYLMAVSVPTIIFGFLTSIGPAYTVVYTEISEKKGKKEGIAYTNTILAILMSISAVAIIVGIVFARPLVRIIAPGFDEASVTLTEEYLRVIVWDTAFSSAVSIFNAFLGCNNKFLNASFSMLFHSSIQIVCTAIAGISDSIFLAYGYVIADLCYLGMMALQSSKIDFKPSIHITKELLEKAKETLKYAIPVFLSAALTQINSYVDKNFASRLGEGTVSALYYSNIMRTFIIMMINTGVTTVLYPTLARYVAKKDFDNGNKAFKEAFRYDVILFIPATLGTILLSETVIRAAYGRGAFSEQSIIMTAGALQMYTIGIAAAGLRDIFNNYLYSLKKMKTSLIISGTCVGFNVLFNSLLINKLGHIGLALGTSLAAIACVPLYILALRNYINLIDKNMICLIIKSFVSSVVMAIIIKLVMHWLLGMNSIVILCISVSVGIVFYMMCMSLFKVEEIISLRKKIRNRI